MNPPPALFSALGRERKPFTYTPGGLDLSEIKSERMAQRLMRNAMNQGVPETPANSLKSPPATGIPTAIPNFNCLPVQVFPSFQLPANPKSLLRTRSNPDGSRETQKPYRPFNENIETNVNKHDINRFSYPNGHERLETNSMHPKQNTAGNYCTLPKTNMNSLCKDAIIYEKPYTFENNDCEIKDTVQQESNILAFRNDENIKIDLIDYNTINSEQNENKEENNFGDTSETEKQQEETTVTKSSTKTENKEETTVTKSSTKTENEVHSQNGDTETAIVVKLPTKKSAAKTETKVEVVQKSLPDGSVQEIKTTTTRTTVDGKTEIATKTETKTISKEETDEETYEEEEEIEDEKNSTTENENIVKETTKQNGEIIKQEEKSETSTTTTKKVVVIQSDAHESEEEAEEVEEEEEEVEEEEEEVDQNVEEVVVIKKQDTAKSVSDDSEEKESKKEEVQNEVDNQSEEECEVEEEEDKEVNEIESKDKNLSGGEDEEEEKNESEEKCENAEVENDEEEKKEPASPGDDTNKEITDTADLNTTTTASSNNVEETVKTETKSEEIIIPIKTESKPIRTEVLREPNVPLEKVEEVEIKPIGAPAQEIITKSTKEIISTTTDNPLAHSTETKYNVIENIVTVNRTTKTLDHAYELPGEYTIPVVKTSLIPESSGVLPPPPPIFNRTYQTSYSKEPTTERRHSLLLERLSVERQLPTSNIYHTDNTYTNHTYDARQLGGEPQSEIVIENNVKPSMVNKNQQWYSRKDSYDYATTGSSIPSQQWNQPQTQPQPQTPTQYQPQPQYQSQPQSQYQSQPQYQQQSQAQYHSQYEYTPQGQSYHQSINQQTQYSPQPQSQPAFNDTYKSSIQNNYSQNTYSSYTPKPSWVNSTVDAKPTSLSNQYSYESESYQKSAQNQNSYVPPPWEQDCGYTNNFSQNTYQPQTPTTPLPKPTPSWKAPTNKFSKSTTSYVPPAPNQSFVKPVSATDPPKISGRKTYYSEYERRYITVPESTYIPTETKFQAQPDASPKYYYDQNEPAESVEPQWRKELREFTEKTQTSSHTTETSVRPPWEEDPKYVTSSEQTNTRTWSQTLRPRSFRERSIESDYTTTTTTAKEWSKSNSLGRGRPQSSYVNNLKRIPERTRGVSVDRYNPNVYQSPIIGEHPPVQSQTLDPTIHPKPHYQHNPNVPAYHNRASAEPREQPAYRQPKWNSHAPPVQSRSFKYLQWITGTED